MDAISEVQETSSIGDKSIEVENDDESTGTGHGKVQGIELKKVKEEEEEEEEEDFETYRLRSMNNEDEEENDENEENEVSPNADDKNQNDKNENDKNDENRNNDRDNDRDSTGDRDDRDENEDEQDEDDYTPDIPEETDEEMRIRVREEERKEAWRKFVDEQCTTVTFVYGCGKRKEVLIHRLMADYSELQREIARLHPKSKQMFVCQYADASIVRSAGFIPANQFKIRELNTTKKVEYDLETRLFHDKLPTKWDFLEYSGSSDVYTEEGKEKRKIVEIIPDIEESETEILEE